MGASMSDAELLRRLRQRDEAAFKELVDRYHAGMVRVAMGYVRDAAAAEDAAQDAWLGVLRGIDAFEGRSSLRTWIYRILINRAISRAKRESGSPATAEAPDTDSDEPAVRADRFDPDPPHHWIAPPRSPGPDPVDELVTREMLDVVEAALATLPDGQREVVTLRDIEGWSAQEVCNALGITETNQRVLLHRGRSRIRMRLEQHLDMDAEGSR